MFTAVIYTSEYCIDTTFLSNGFTYFILHHKITKITQEAMQQVFSWKMLVWLTQHAVMKPRNEIFHGNDDSTENSEMGQLGNQRENNQLSGENM